MLMNMISFQSLDYGNVYGNVYIQLPSYSQFDFIQLLVNGIMTV